MRSVLTVSDAKEQVYSRIIMRTVSIIFIFSFLIFVFLSSPTDGAGLVNEVDENGKAFPSMATPCEVSCRRESEKKRNAVLCLCSLSLSDDEDKSAELILSSSFAKKMSNKIRGRREVKEEDGNEDHKKKKKKHKKHKAKKHHHHHNKQKPTVTVTTAEAMKAGLGESEDRREENRKSVMAVVICVICVAAALLLFFLVLDCRGRMDPNKRALDCFDEESICDGRIVGGVEVAKDAVGAKSTEELRRGETLKRLSSIDACSVDSIEPVVGNLEPLPHQWTTSSIVANHQHTRV